MKDQKSMKMLSAIGGIGEDIIDEAGALRPVRRRPRALIVAAAVVGLLTVLFMTSVAAAYDIGFYVSQIFGGDVEMLNEMTAKPGHVFTTATNDDVKFEVVGITGDRTNAYIWIDIILPEDCDIEGKHLAIRNFEANKRWALFSVDDFSTSYGFPQHKQGNVYSMFCQIGSSNSLIGQRIKLTVEDICTVPEGVIVNPKYYETLAEGKWTLSFSLNYPDLTKEYAPDIKGQTAHIPEQSLVGMPDKVTDLAVDEFEVDTCRVLLSPMSIRVSMTCVENVMVYLPPEIKLILSDESVVDGYMSSGGHIYSAEEQTSYFWSAAIFNEPLSSDRVVAIEYCGITIPLK